MRADGRLSVYLVEDSPLFVEMLTRLIHDDADARVVGSHGDAGKAMTDVMQLRPEVAIVDLHLASGTGYDVVRWIKSHVRSTSVIVLTGFASQEYRDAARQMGVPDDDYFDKHGDLSPLLQRLRQYAEAKSQRHGDRTSMA
jgi:DNA-binding NarL/FixJ family response regulator